MNMHTFPQDSSDAPKVWAIAFGTVALALRAEPVPRLGADALRSTIAKEVSRG